MRRALLAAALVAAPFVTTTPASAVGGVIQPGDYMVAGNAACTNNFVFDGTGSLTGRVFVGTAAHCVTHVDQQVRNINNTHWGDVEIIGDANGTATDWAFIEVRAGITVSAKVKGNLTYPTGVTTPAETNAGDLVQISGYGLGFNFTNVTQERRVAVLSSDNASTHAVAGPIDFGDSGGPLVHVRTGKALGIVSRLCVGACTETGPTVEGMIAQAAARGFTVALRTA